ncbi:MAG: hypothetical protein IT177_11605 [Acidobacteria bacterium]|nr:hypothetical protein [Acidobacteriota bacterium]
MSTAPTLDARLDTITQQLRSALALCQVIIDHDRGSTLSGLDLKPADLAAPARAHVADALEQVYWLQQLPPAVRALLAPTDDEAAAMGRPRSWEQDEPETAGAR